MWKVVEIQLTFLIHESSNFQSDSAQCCQIAIASEIKKRSSSHISRQMLIINSLFHYKIITEYARIKKSRTHSLYKYKFLLVKSSQ